MMIVGAQFGGVDHKIDVCAPANGSCFRVQAVVGMNHLYLRTYHGPVFFANDVVALAYILYLYKCRSLVHPLLVWQDRTVHNLVRSVFGAYLDVFVALQLMVS